MANKDQSKRWKLCKECKGLGKVLNGSEFEKCKPCKGTGTVKR